MKRTGFTLIEILVVVSIVAVLCGIIFAAMAPAREKARQSVCVSNLHQMGRAISMYVQDYDGIEPQKGVPTTALQMAMPDRSDAIKPYLSGNLDVFYCLSYHGTEPVVKGIGNTYHLPFALNENITPEVGFQSLTKLKGQDYVLAGCEQHNSNLDFRRQAYWMTKNVLVLRYSQQVKFAIVPVRMDSFDW